MHRSRISPTQSTECLIPDDALLKPRDPAIFFTQVDYFRVARHRDQPHEVSRSNCSQIASTKGRVGVSDMTKHSLTGNHGSFA